jgi:hypothetical protein
MLPVMPNGLSFVFIVYGKNTHKTVNNARKLILVDDLHIKFLLKLLKLFLYIDFIVL